MWPILFEIAIILVLILFNGYFALAEIAVISARKARLQHRADEGDQAAGVALDLATRPDRFLATVQVGITLIGILAGAFGGATLAARLAPRIAAVPGLEGQGDWLALALVVAAVTYLSLVMGELVPKNLALTDPERVARAVARPMNALAHIAAPLVALLRVSNNAVLRLLRRSPTVQTPVTEDELRVMVAQGTAAGVFEPVERSIFERVIRLDERRVGSLMTPRLEIVWIDRNLSIGEAMRVMSAAGHTHYPVCDGSLDQVLGVVSVKDQWARMVNRQPPDLLASVRPVPFVPESMSALDLLGTLRQANRDVALAVDEYGSISGLVTLHNVLEAVVGDVPSGRAGEETMIVRREDGSFLVDGMVAIDELEHLLEIELPDERDFDTVGGFCLRELGRIPQVGESFDWGRFRFEIVDMDGHRIDRVLITPAPSRPGPTAVAP